MNEKIATELESVLGEVISFMEDALEASGQHQEKIATLREQLQAAKTEHEKVTLQKVAEARNSVIDMKLAEQTLSELEAMNVISAAAHKKLASQIEQNPNYLFPMLTTLATSLTSAPAEGQGVESEKSAALTPADADGWTRLGTNKEVKIRD